MTQSSGYLNDLLNQPQALTETLAGLDEIDPSLAGIADRLARGEFRNVILTGMGSSYYAFHPLQQALVRAGVPALMVETGELIHSLPGLLTSQNLVIAASQSGRSAETVQLVNRMQGAGKANFLGISNTAGSPLALGTHTCLLTRAGAEETVSCKTYLAALLALSWLEPILTEAGQAARKTRRAELAAAPQAVAAYLNNWQVFVEELSALLAGITNLFLAGRGPSLAAAEVGGLIIKEAAHMHSEGLSSAAFRHGPFEMLSPQVFVMVYSGLGPDAALNRRLVSDVRAAGGLSALVESGVSGPFGLPAAPASLLPVLEILPAQMLTLALSGLHGHVAGHFERATKVTATE